MRKKNKWIRKNNSGNVRHTHTHSHKTVQNGLDY